MKYILIAGAKRSGKNYVGELLLKVLKDKAVLDSFAAPMKRILAKTLGITVEKLEKLKNSNLVYRRYLQVFGTEASKAEFGDTVWADLMYSKDRNSEVVIVTDFRFPEEYKEGAITIHINNPTIIQDERSLHVSETALKYFEFDYYITSDPRKPIEDLESQLEYILQKEGLV